MGILQAADTEGDLKWKKKKKKLECLLGQVSSNSQQRFKKRFKKAEV